MSVAAKIVSKSQHQLKNGTIVEVVFPQALSENDSEDSTTEDTESDSEEESGGIISNFVPWLF